MNDSKVVAKVGEEVELQGIRLLARFGDMATHLKDPCKGCVFHGDCRAHEIEKSCVEHDVIWVPATQADAVTFKLLGEKFK